MITPDDLAVISMALARMLDQARRKRDRAIERGDAGKAKLYGELAADVAGVQTKVLASARRRADFWETDAARDCLCGSPTVVSWRTDVK